MNFSFQNVKILSKIFKIIGFLAITHNIYSQEIKFFDNVSYSKSFMGDTRSPITKIEPGFLNKVSPYYYNENVKNRPFTESHLGYDINIFSYIGSTSRFAISLPGGSVTLTDFMEIYTAPVINTDYWFGTCLKFISNPFSNSSLFFKNISLRILPYFHESTHLGDEFSIRGYQQIEDFKRVNISYEAWKFSIILNDPDTLSGNILSIKAGIQNLWLKKSGYYFSDSIETKGAEIQKSSKTFEYFLALNYKRSEGYLCSKRFNNILSFELSNRPKFSFDYSIPEDRTWSYNAYFGWIYKQSDKPFRNVGLFFRYYYGINPHGQFRNDDQFNFLALSISLI